MYESVFRDVLVYVPQHDGTPQRMRLRVRAGMHVDELLFQIERQLAEETASHVTRPLDSEQYAVLLMREGDHALLPFADATSEVLMSCTRVMLRRRCLPQRSSDVHGDAAALRVSDTSDDGCTTRMAPMCSRGDAAAAGGAAQPSLPSARDSSDTAVQHDSNGSKQQQQQQQQRQQQEQQRESNTMRTTRAMLTVVERLCTDFALHAAADHRPMDEEQWSTLVQYAATRAHVDVEQFDESIVRAFRRAIVDPIARVQRFRNNNNDDDNDDGDDCRAKGVMGEDVAVCSDSVARAASAATHNGRNLCDDDVCDASDEQVPRHKRVHAAA